MVEASAEGLQAAIVHGLEESTPKARICARTQPWFGQNASRKAMNDLRRSWQKMRGKRGREGTPDEAEVDRTHRAYKAAQRAHHGAIRLAKRTFQRESLAAAGPGEVWKLAKLGSRGQQATMVAPLITPDGREATRPEEQAQVLRAGLRPAQAQEDDVDEVEEADESFSVLSDVDFSAPVFQWTPFSQREIAERIGKAKVRSAPGPNAITWPALKILMRKWNRFVPVLQRLFNECMEKRYHPRVFKAATTVILRKPGKPDYSVTGAYRPIALLNTLGKLLEAIVAARVLAQAERHPHLLAAGHFGGRPGRSTEDALLQLKQFIDDSHRQARPVVLVSMDVSGAYNGVRKGPLARDLRMAGWPEEVVGWAESFMEERESELRLGDYTDPTAPIPDGLPQGSPISQLLWLAYSRDLVDAGDGPASARAKKMSIGWVDDINAVFSHRDPERMFGMAQDFLNQATRWATTHRAAFDQKKSVVCLLERPGVDAARGNQPSRDLTLNGRPIPMVEHTKILGVTFQDDGKFDRHVSSVVAKATRSVNALLGHGNRAWGFGVDNARLLYQVGVVPVMGYAAAVWLKPWGTMRGSAKHLGAMAKVQRLAAIRIGGAYRSTATEVLDFEAGLLPIDLKMYEQQQRTLVRLCTLPEEHPIVPIVERTKQDVGRRPGQLHLLHRAYPEVKEARLQRKLAKRPPGHEVPQATIHNSAEAAIEHHSQVLRDHLEDALQVYTDGSGIEGRFGGAVRAANGYIVEGGYDPIDIPLGSRSTVYRAEVKAICKALESIPVGQRANIWSDSQAALLAISGTASQDEDVRAVQDQWVKLGSRVELAWVPGHAGIPGNEAADQAAKAAALQDVADEECWDEAAGVKLRIRRALMEEWQARFDGTAKGRLHKKVNTMKVGETRRLYRGKARSTVSIMVQLRSGHIGLNRYLSKRRCADDARCDRCKEVDTREHVLLSCAATSAARLAATREFGVRKATSTRFLLNSREAIPHAARIASARLRAYAHK